MATSDPNAITSSAASAPRHGEDPGGREACFLPGTASPCCASDAGLPGCDGFVYATPTLREETGHRVSAACHVPPALAPGRFTVREMTGVIAPPGLVFSTWCAALRARHYSRPTEEAYVAWKRAVGPGSR
jgi:hypothetical protein